MRALLLLSMLVPVLLSGCFKSRLPESQLEMAEIYNGTTDSAFAQSPASLRRVHDAGTDLAPYTREAATELSTRFPRVPNPTLVMYVFPHLARDMPVPGYVTTFPTWESAPFALPGETVRVTDEILP